MCEKIKKPPTIRNTKIAKKEIFEYTNGEYELLSEYKNVTDKLELLHIPCGKKCNISFRNIFRNQRCPYCYPTSDKTKHIITKEEFNGLFLLPENKDYELKDEFVNNGTKLQILHKKCNTITSISPKNFKDGQRCSKCTKEFQTKNQTKTHEQFVKEINNIFGTDYSIIGQYENRNTKILVKHNVCNSIYCALPSNLLKKEGCPICAKKANRKSNEQFLKEVNDLVGNEYFPLEEYTNSKTKIKFKHNTCGNEFEIRPDSFFKGTRCPICTLNSKKKSNNQEAQKVIDKKLIKSNIKIKPRYDSCTKNNKKSNEQFLKEVKNIVGDEYSPLEEYQGTDTKIKFKHNTCNCIFSKTPAKFLRGYRCPECAKIAVTKARTKTNEQFLKDLYDLVGSDFSALEEYKGAYTKIRFIHNICGSEFELKPTPFLERPRCPVCTKIALSKARAKTNEQFLKDLYDLVGNDYSALEEYKNNATKIKFRHNACGNEFYTTPTIILNGSKCPECSIKLLTKTNEQFLKEVNDLVGDEYSPLEEYKGAQTKIKFKHNTCGNKFLKTPTKFLSGQRCPECAKKARFKTNEQFLKEVNDLVGNEYSSLEEYKGTQTKIKFKHNLCGNEFLKTPNSFLNGVKCPFCQKSISKGELKIINYLENNNINFKGQYSFSDCKNIKELNFDFAIFDKKNELYCLIEFDGAQHFKPISAFGGEEALEYTRLRDSIKNNYCKDKNIKLLRIPYNKYKNIEEILNDFIPKELYLDNVS